MAEQSVEEVLNDSQILLNTKLERKERTSLLFSWHIPNYSRLRKNVFYSRNSISRENTWKFRVIKARGTLFTVLLSNAVAKEVYFSLISKTSIRLMNRRCVEIYDGMYVAEFCRKAVEKEAFLKDDILTVQCRIHVKLDNERLLILPYNQPRDSTDVFQLCHDFRELFLEQQFSDFTIEVNNLEFFDVHKTVLVARSPFFDKYFEEDEFRLSIYITSSASAMTDVLTYIYCGEFHIRDVPVMAEVMYIAQAFKLHCLFAKCADFFASQITLEDLTKMRRTADMCGNVKLRNAAAQFMIKKYGKVYT